MSIRTGEGVTDLSVTKTFVLEECCNCGVDYAVTSTFRATRRRDGQMFYCPNGHPQHYTETDATRLKKAQEQLEREREQARTRQIALEDQRLAAERSAAAARGQVTKLKKRVANGVCPCCKRSFANLHRHIAGQHPDFAEATP